MGYIDTRMPCGFAGDVTRTHGAVIEPVQVGDTDIANGAPVKLSGDVIVAMEAADTADDLYGFVVRSYPNQGGFGSTTENVAPAGSMADVLRSGYMAVPLASGTGSKGGKVYVRVDATSGSLGDIEDALVDGETVAINATFMGEASDDIVEIAYNI